MHSTLRKSPLALAIAAGLAATGSAHAQVMWNDLAGGIWSDASNWMPMTVPSANTETAVFPAGTYTVTHDINTDLDGIEIDGSGVQVRVNPARTLGINAGGIQNEGNIFVNSTASSSNSNLNFFANGSITGSGSITLNGFGADAGMNTAPGVTITHGAGHTITGRGLINASLINQGTIEANAGATQLQLFGEDKVNQSLIVARNGGTGIQIASSLNLDNTGGELRADGAPFTFVTGSGGTVTGGLFNATPGSIMNKQSGSWTLDGVTLQGQLNLDLSTTTNLAAGGIQNNGLILVNSSASSSDARIVFLDDGAFGGTGTVRLNGSAADANIGSMDDAVVTNGPDHTIIGRGDFTAPLVNEGVVEADGVTQLRVTSPTVRNVGVMRATGSTGLDLINTDVDQTALPLRGGLGSDGVIRAIDSTVRFPTGTNTSITGGDLIATGTGRFRRDSSGTTTLIDVSLDGPLDTFIGSTLALEGSFTSQQTVTINQSASSSDCVLDILNSLVISGPGQIVLNGSAADSRLDSQPGATLTLASDHTIRGRGQINASLVNNGTITADGVTPLILRDQDKINNATMRAEGTGGLEISGITLDQTGGGEIVSDGANTLFGTGTNSMVLGGTLTSANGGLFARRSSGTTTLDSVTLNGDMNVDLASTLEIAGSGLTHNGLIRVNPLASSADVVLDFIESGTLSGTGEMAFNGSGLDARMESAPGAVATIGPDYTVSGRGTLNAELINDGLVLVNSQGFILTLADRDKTNRSVMEAVADGKGVTVAILSLAGSDITQTSSGVMRADGPGARVSIANVIGGTSVVGGTIEGINGGIFDIVSSADAALSGVTLDTDTNANLAVDLFLDGNVTNNGLINVNPSSSSADTFVTARTDVVVGGTGRINLQGNALDSRLGADEGFSLTLGENQDLSGRGTVFGDFITLGNTEIGLVPDTTQRTLAAADSFSQGDTSSIAFDLYSSVVHDRLNVSEMISVDGQLDATLRNGYVPATPTRHAIITAGSVDGRFDTLTINGGDISPLVWRVGYRLSGIDLWATCSGDMTTDGSNPGDDAFGAPDGVVTVSDLSYFVELWLANDVDVADVTTNNTNPGDPGFGVPDGLIGIADLTFFVERWVEGCP
ncbi:MAG: GC-type dockerin domain-anchored protein [Planctomycetota bacterium]